MPGFVLRPVMSRRSTRFWLRHRRSAHPEAIGSGIGINAAHEMAHQFLLRTDGMSSINTYNGLSCDGSTARWVYGLGPIRWEDTTGKALKDKLGAGWHR